MTATTKFNAITGAVLCVCVAVGPVGCRTNSDSALLPASSNTGCTAPVPDSEIPLPVAPASERVDLYEPSFSNPTQITNPLFPIGNLNQVVFLGLEEGAPFRAETTLLPYTRTVNLHGRKVKTLVSQYFAYIDGRIAEIAIDLYAQADDGSVWYFGEDVFNYEDGVVADTEGTWLACQDGPPAMIMPADPQVGDVYRPENSFGIVFEEVNVTQTGMTVDGPHGPVAGAIVAHELHMDGTMEDKVFAPGYGEFSTGSGSNLEAVALAVPTDALPGPAPVELVTLSDGASELFDAAEAADWSAAANILASMNAAWTAFQAGPVPPALGTQMDDVLASLAAAVSAEDAEAARQASIEVDRAALDLQLRYRPVVEVDLARLDAWARQVMVDAAAEDLAGVNSTVAIIQWTWDRVRDAVDQSSAVSVGQTLHALQRAARAEDFEAASGAAVQLREVLAAVQLEVDDTEVAGLDDDDGNVDDVGDDGDDDRDDADSDDDEDEDEDEDDGDEDD